MALTCSFQAKATGCTKRLVITFWFSSASLFSRVARKLRPELSRAKAAPRQLLTAISNKTIRFRHKKREIEMDGSDREFGLWQRSILMGEKCEPLNFSGVIYYDSNGKQLEEIPARSPRASPLPGYVCNSAARREF